jgi:shikimate kinase
MNRSNVRVLRNNCLSVWLWADAKTALDRIGDTATRPVLRTGTETEGAARALLAKRMPFYARTSDLLVNTTGKTPEEIARRIWDEFGNAFGD